jgi:hypothetical protein
LQAPGLALGGHLGQTGIGLRPPRQFLARQPQGNRQFDFPFPLAPVAAQLITQAGQGHGGRPRRHGGGQLGPGAGFLLQRRIGAGLGMTGPGLLQGDGQGAGPDRRAGKLAEQEGKQQGDRGFHHGIPRWMDAILRAAGRHPPDARITNL